MRPVRVVIFTRAGVPTRIVAEQPLDVEVLDEELREPSVHWFVPETYVHAMMVDWRIDRHNFRVGGVRMRKNLWYVGYTGPQVPDPAFFPSDEEWEAAGLEIVWADQFGVIVRGDREAAERVIENYPYQTLYGTPATGRWVFEGGDELYILNGEIVEDPESLWEGCGLRPQDFGAESWEEVDSSEVWDQIPVF